jgi:hypothetical protein
MQEHGRLVGALDASLLMYARFGLIVGNYVMALKGTGSLSADHADAGQRRVHCMYLCSWPRRSRFQIHAQAFPCRSAAPQRDSGKLEPMNKEQRL